MSIEKVPVTIITGFLGAGKTTLVRHLMQNPQGRRLAILVNEFGDLGIDGDILKGCADADCPEDAIVELTNGCLCCTVADDFVPTIAALLARPQPPDHILIETSGLALPKPLPRDGGQIGREPAVRDGFGIGDRDHAIDRDAGSQVRPIEGF